MNKLLKWRLVVLAIFTTLLGGTFIFKPDVDKTGGLVANVKLADIEKPLITKPDKPVVKKKPVVKRTPPAKKVSKPKPKKSVKLTPKPKPLSRVFFEDFRDYPDGHLMADWGNDIIVKKSGFGGKLLTSQVASKYHSMTMPIPFPEHWRLTIVATLACGALTSITFYDMRGNQLSIKCSYRFCNGPMYLTFPGGAKITTPFDMEEGSYLFEIAYVDNILKFVLNKQHLFTGKFPNYGMFNRLQITWQDFKPPYGEMYRIKHDFEWFEVWPMKGRLQSSISDKSSNQVTLAAGLTNKEAAAIPSNVVQFKNKITVSGSRFTCRCSRCLQTFPNGRNYALNQFFWGVFLGEHGITHLDQASRQWFKKTYGIP